METVARQVAEVGRSQGTVRPIMRRLRPRSTPRPRIAESLVAQMLSCSTHGAGIRSTRAGVKISEQYESHRATYRKVHVYMFEVQKDGEQNAAHQILTLQYCQCCPIEARERHTFRAMRSDQSMIPNMKPLYWKWIWSIMRKPGCKNSEADSNRCTLASRAPRTKLHSNFRTAAEMTANVPE